MQQAGTWDGGSQIAVEGLSVMRPARPIARTSEQAVCQGSQQTVPLVGDPPHDAPLVSSRPNADRRVKPNRQAVALFRQELGHLKLVGREHVLRKSYLPTVQVDVDNRVDAFEPKRDRLV